MVTATMMTCITVIGALEINSRGSSLTDIRPLSVIYRAARADGEA
jgi:hypothetical protein